MIKITHLRILLVITFLLLAFFQGIECIRFILKDNIPLVIWGNLGVLFWLCNAWNFRNIEVYYDGKYFNRFFDIN